MKALNFALVMVALQLPNFEIYFVKQTETNGEWKSLPRE
jgi:hypothetical protein